MSAAPTDPAVSQPTAPAAPAAAAAAPVDPAAPFDFEELVRRERAWIAGRARAEAGAAAPANFRVATSPLTGEPWVSFTSEDQFGLALSGGGIRSATFNLGLLQALNEKGVLSRLDYLSTVSGGGYAGGFLNAWQHRHPGPEAFPKAEGFDAAAASGSQTREPAPVRHVREFSRFIAPRVGVLATDTWNAIVTIVGGMIPALAAAGALLVLAIFAWLWLGVALLDGTEPFLEWIGFGRVQPALLDGAAFGAVTFALLALGTRRASVPDQDGRFSVLRLLTAILAAIAWSVHALTAPAGVKAALTLGFNVWSSDWHNPIDTTAAVGGAFAPVMAWMGTAFILFLLRALAARFTTPASVNWSVRIDRIIGLCLAAALGWAVLALLWQLSRTIYLSHYTKLTSAAVGAGAAASGGLFAALREWLTKPKEETNAGTVLQKALTLLRPVLLQVLAVVAVAMLAAFMCLGLQHAMVTQRLDLVLIAAAVIIAATLTIFDPARMGMHDFYRGRICRAFLGASNATESHLHRSTIENAADDLTFGELRAERRDARRPLHLVCCTANNLAGDVLASLYRGGRSATLSAEGFAIGDCAAQRDTVRLSSALTASAAAFNSQMGRISMDYGPAVAFLMCALNLRLGLWVRHPLNHTTTSRLLPGLPFFKEMLGRTRADQQTDPAKAGAQAWRYRFTDVHLSDGGHFENLALYELVRRHCRYIIVSDCAADPEVHFDDLAIALRTIREDFGIEIDLDVSPLRHGENGIARQHAVVGTIHYDGLRGLDKGTILYFKPSLTGDEPPDVLQYHSRNEAFPHESTGDQFYDEAQWESYRRLGQHAGNVVFHFVESYSLRRRASARFVENVFLDAARSWHPAPERQGEVFLALTERCAELEKEVRENAPAYLRAEFFPEAFAAAGGQVEEPSNLGAPSVAEETDALYFLMLAAQVMEDVWVGAELDLYWSHPLNEGWMNYFHRWAGTPSFRRWWPVLRPIFSAGFRDFVRERFGVGYADDPQASGARLELRERYSGTGLAWSYWRQQNPGGLRPGQRVVEFWLRLDPTASAPGTGELLVGLLVFEADAARRTVTWRSDQLFVPPSLNGAGITTRFLERVLTLFQSSGFRELEVVFEAGKSRPDPANRLRRVQEINFYKSRGFVAPQPAAPGEDLRLTLACKDGGAALLAIFVRQIEEIGLPLAVPATEGDGTATRPKPREASGLRAEHTDHAD